MAITSTAQRDFDVQILTDTVRGVFGGKNAFMGSRLVASGAVTINDQMPHADPRMIGNSITVPYFGTIGDFTNNPDGSSVATSQLFTTNEQSSITRDSLAFEVSYWAQHSGPSDADPYEEASRQIMVSAERAQDKRIITAAAGTPLISDIYNSTTPAYITYAAMADAMAKWGDENSDVVGLVAHSRTITDLRKTLASDGRPLLTDGQRFGEVPMFMGVPVIQSDRVPLTGSTMGAVTSAGSSPPVATLTGTPTGAWNLKIDCPVGGAHATATFRFSTDGGNTWSAQIATVGAASVIPLVDTAKDSLVGLNGTTGISVAFAAGTFSTNNTWTSTANLKVSTLILKRNALAFYYSRAGLAMDTINVPQAHTNIAAMHLYAVAHRYRRAPGGTKPGVVNLQHNVSGFTG